MDFSDLKLTEYKRHQQTQNYQNIAVHFEIQILKEKSNSLQGIVE